ncbi:aromatic di-alanine and TPR containing protein [Ceratobasidium sp. AG-Ba]|nr:aromatic di-alanine and TPR containing protein [Ceratobasidium sp. AG-Ba]
MKVRDLAAEAAAWAISADLYSLALEWLEQGRSVVWGQTLQLRMPVQDLALADPKLAQKLQDMACWLDTAGSTPTPQSYNIDSRTNSMSYTEHYHRLALEWDELLEQSRLLPGFHDFMRPLKWEELRRAAHDGPVVVINTHETQCDALIILPNVDDVMHVLLTGVSTKQLDELSKQALSLAGQRGNLSASRHVVWGIAEQNTKLTEQLWLWVSSRKRFRFA